MKAIRVIALFLIVIGALNWGLVGFFKYDLVAHIFGGMTATWSRIIYAFIGVAGIYGLSFLCGCKCGPSCGCGCSSKK